MSWPRDIDAVTMDQEEIPGQGIPPVPAVRTIRPPIQPYFMSGFQDSDVPLRFELDARTRNLLIRNPPGSQEDLVWAWQQPDTIGGRLRPGEDLAMDEITLPSNVFFLELAVDNHGFGFFYQVWGW